jgi:hypothetical protein
LYRYFQPGKAGAPEPGAGFSSTPNGVVSNTSVRRGQKFLNGGE